MSGSRDFDFWLVRVHFFFENNLGFRMLWLWLLICFKIFLWTSCVQNEDLRETSVNQILSTSSEEKWLWKQSSIMHGVHSSLAPWPPTPRTELSTWTFPWLFCIFDQRKSSPKLGLYSTERNFWGTLRELLEGNFSLYIMGVSILKLRTSRAQYYPVGWCPHPRIRRDAVLSRSYILYSTFQNFNNIDLPITRNGGLLSAAI